MSGIGATGVILLVLVALLLFGPNKLPELGRAFGRTLREFKSGAREIMDDDDRDRDRKDKDSSRVEVSRSENSDKDNKRLPD
ncbi:Sec-independent protein translocase TatA [Paenibacillus sp. FSL A5-0031]|uniref:twin-arginine translocase TatA/TatE family subunit n=1 Tax=unclassified Paenibacillus TaxID=185978 RepID=UPI00096C41E0|nr:twin-arginine translocase TatA/TatE family subunit [Paenibacillus sp. FSL A5-0031]OME79003.1 Sec-independent protein translocase TatA [Paenibacillus sp. FSL A5-0031]